MKKTRCEIIRTRLGLTQAEMAERLGVNQGTVSRLERGAKPSRPVLKLMELLASEISTMN
jgi:transcriptional regulator with XRE-family HTH domain